MRGGGIKIGRVLGIPILLHTSWFFVFLLSTYSFATEFAALNPKWSPVQHWAIGLVTSALFFGSVLFHELSHSVVAKHYKIPVISITLFIFGGVARISREPDSAKQEFLIAVAGPLSSFTLAGGFWALAAATPDASVANAVGTWLSQINFGLGAFNLVPGFPLDGGRILRSIVWGITKNYTKSARIAARTGQAVAYGMIALGGWIALRAYQSGGDVLGGLWLAFIGWFVLSAARQSYAQVATRGALEGLRVADIMTSEAPVVARDITLEEYAREVTRTGRRAHLVVTGGQLVGLMNVALLQAVPREEWPMMSVQAVMLTRDRLPWAAPEESALELLDRMRRSDIEQMAVVTEGSVVGLVARDSILRVIEARNDLGHIPNQ